VDDTLDRPLEPDPVIEAYKKDVDVTLLIENLRRTPEERFQALESFTRFLEELRRGSVEPPSHGRDAVASR
jgi:hypothetical protein